MYHAEARCPHHAVVCPLSEALSLKQFWMLNLECSFLAEVSLWSGTRRYPVTFPNAAFLTSPILPLFCITVTMEDPASAVR